MMYASFKSKYQRLWDKINNTYNLTYPKLMNYLYETYIRDFRCYFIECYINKVLHFNTTVMSYDKSAYAI